MQRILLYSTFHPSTTTIPSHPYSGCQTFSLRVPSEFNNRFSRSFTKIRSSYFNHARENYTQHLLYYAQVSRSKVFKSSSNFEHVLISLNTFILCAVLTELALILFFQRRTMWNCCVSGNLNFNIDKQ